MSRRISDLSIGTRLFVGFAAVLAILLAAGLFGLYRLETELRAQIGESSHSMARSILEQAGRDVYARLEAMRQLALTTPEIERALRQSNLRLAASGSASEIRDRIDRDDQRWSAYAQGAKAAQQGMPSFMAEAVAHPVSELLRRKLDFFRREADHAVFSEIFVTNRFGVNVAQTSLTSDYRQDDEGWWAAAWSDGVSVGDVAFDDSSGVYSIDFSVRVDAAGGEPLGVMKAVLDIEEVRRVLAAFEAAITTKGASLELVDRHGTRLYPEFESRPRGAAPPADGSWLAADEDGTKRLYAAARSLPHERYPDLGWTLIVSFPRASIFAPILTQRRQLLIAGGLVALLALAATVAISLSITRPLEHAVEASRRLARGDLRIAFGHRRGDETGRLLEALSAMVTNVRRTIESLVDVSRRVRSLAGTLSQTADRIAAGAGNQTRAMSDGVAAVAAMADSMKQVALSSGKMRDEVFETSAAVEEMATSTDVVARNTVHLAAGVEETLAAVRHLAASIGRVSAGADAAGQSSRTALSEAKSGGEAVRRTIEEMASIGSAVEEMVAVAEHLQSSSQRINQVIELIEDLARQTNLLALNAAIQAANAGEHGTGFAVVAAEVQRLAERSAGSTHEIAELVAAVQEDTERAARISQQGAEKSRQGVALAGRAGEALERIVESAARVQDGLQEIGRFAGEQAGVADELVSTFEQMQGRTQEVEQATREQATGGERIREAMALVTGQAQQVGDAVRRHRNDSRLVDEAVAHITRITAENAATAEEIVRSTSALAEAAEALRSLASFFVLSDRGGAGGGPGPASPTRP